MNESTRVMPASAPPEDRTMVAPAAGLAAAPPAGATMMAATVTCAVCDTPNGGFETYCAECGFLLASAPGVSEEAAPEEVAAFELAEASTGRHFVLRNGTTTVGREGCDILLLDGTVSRRHAQISVEGGQAKLTDLGSTNGTQVNGNRLSPNTPTQLAPGDTVRFGNASLTLTGDAAPAEATIVSAPPPADVTMVAASPMSSSDDEPSAEPMTDGEAEAAVGSLFRFSAQTPGASSFDVGEGQTTIGRRPGNAVVVATDPYISGQHAIVEVNPTGCYLTDAGSTNGSMVNGVKMEANVRQLLLDGDEVTLGQTTFRFETLEAPEEATDEPDRADMSAPSDQPDSSDTAIDDE